MKTFSEYHEANDRIGWGGVEHGNMLTIAGSYTAPSVEEAKRVMEELKSLGFEAEMADGPYVFVGAQFDYSKATFEEVVAEAEKFAQNLKLLLKASKLYPMEINGDID